MKIYKITEASDYLGVSINTLKTLANNGKIKSFKTTGEHRRFRQEDLDAYMGVEEELDDVLTEKQFAAFGRAVRKEIIEREWWSDVDHFELCVLALENGICTRVPYDPQIHGENIEADPGDEIFWFGD
jgi:excisionase family DNA binding protein